MACTPEQQRVRLARKRLAETDEELIKCLECPLSFVRVGSHVVQVHGYESVLEYRRAHGLMAKETRLESHADKMRKLASTHENLEKGKHRRFTKGGGHAEYLRSWWSNRRESYGK